MPSDTSCTSDGSWSLEQDSLPPKKPAREPLAAPPGSWSPRGKAEVLLREDAPAEGKGTLIPGAEEGSRPAFLQRQAAVRHVSGNGAPEHCA